MSHQIQIPLRGANWFPVAHLTPKIRAAVQEVTLATKAPHALIASTALSAASLAVQSKFDIRRRKNLTSPCSLFVLTIAESGERKTTVDNLFFSKFRKFEKDCEATKVEAQDKPDQLYAPDLELRVLYNDTTPSAFLKGLSENGNSAGLIEDEAGRMLDGRMVDDIGLLNKLWGGQDIHVDRRFQSFTVKSPRATINWMVQPSIFGKYMERKGESIRGIGFLARCLVSYPESTQGWRFIDFNDIDTPAIDAFGQRVTELLTDQHNLFLNPNERSRVELNFSLNAQHEWVNIFNAIEQSLQPGGQFCQNRDYASKVAEMIARLAGVMHAFEGYGGSEVSLETLKSATCIAMWYANEFVRLFTPPGPIDLVNRNVATLDNWLKDWAKQGGPRCIRKNDLLQLAPKALRHSAAINVCLDTLSQWGRLHFSQSFVQSPIAMTAPKRATQFIMLGNYYYQNSSIFTN